MGHRSVCVCRIVLPSLYIHTHSRGAHRIYVALTPRLSLKHEIIILDNGSHCRRANLKYSVDGIVIAHVLENSIRLVFIRTN